MWFDSIREFMDNRTAHLVPGCDCMIWRDHEEIFRYTSGYADLEKRRYIEGNELYFLWSMSKVVTVALALKLYEEGKFDLTEPIYRYLPEYEHMYIAQSGTNATTAARCPITVRDLFAMTAGMNYNISSKYLDEARKMTDFRCPTREMIRAMAKEPLDFEPGETWQYGFCHDVLGALIEVVSGMRLRDYAKKVLFDPLEMVDTSYGLPGDAEKQSRFARLYQYREDLGKCIPTKDTCNFIFGAEYDSGGAGVISTVSDSMKFADTLASFGLSANGYRFLSRETVELLRTNVLGEEQLNRFWFASEGYGYGLGVRTLIDKEKRGALSHIGEFGWAGAAGAIVMMDPAERLAIVYLEHVLATPDTRVFARLRDMVYAEIK